MINIKLLGIGVIASTLVCLMTYQLGQSNIQKKWDKEKEAQQKLLTEVQNKYDALYEGHKEYVLLISSTLFEKDSTHAKTLDDIGRNTANGLRKSEDRATYYQRQAEAGEAESRNLASHAAQLDRSLVEGKQVAAELAATVRLRDSQIGALGSIIKADRLVIGETE